MVRLGDVSFSYKNSEKKQLCDISVEIKKGDFILLCGKSGSGKTTVTRLINGLIPHFTAGEMTGLAELNGKDTRTLKIYEIAAQAGSIFQNPKTQFFNLDSDSELIFGLENMGAGPDKIRERVAITQEALGIAHLQNRNVFKMSGGEKQLLAIASVYAVNPEIYVFDEPSSNIDETGIEALREVLKKLKSEGKTIIISEHRLYYFLDLIDRAFYLEEGKISKVFEREEMTRLSETERKALGLRSFVREIPGPHIKSCSFCEQDELRLDHISCSIHGKAILRDIRLSANRGDVVAITGPNGAGKSTLMRLLCGLIKEAGGSIQYKGRPYRPGRRRRLCYMVMQEVIHQLFGESVYQEFLLTRPGLREEEIDRCLDRMGLLPYKEVYPLALSGGQMQRLAVAAAMLMQRDIMIFDEPTSGLDYTNMLRIASLIKELSKEKIIFIITHDRELINACCTRVVRMEKGTIKEGWREPCLS